MKEPGRTICFFIALLLFAMFLMLWHARSQYALAQVTCQRGWTARQLYVHSWFNTLTLGMYAVLKAGPLRGTIEPDDGLLLDTVKKQNVFTQPQMD